MSRLPVLDERFTSLRAHERDMMRDVERLTIADLRKLPLLSGNAKTSVSLDFPIGHTCQPTALCSRLCYASRPGTPARWDKSLRMRLRTLHYFQLASTDEACDRLIREYRSQQAKWRKHGVELTHLRINGTGDLCPEVVPALNQFMERCPDVRLWVVTRKLELAARLRQCPNLYLQISVDASSTPRFVHDAERMVRENLRAYLSFLRTSTNEDDHGAAIVFHEKRTELPWGGVTDCPADAGRLPLNNVRGKGGTACATCRKCFSEETLARQRLTAA
ncbi:MAG TPA: hypothetical protein VLN57_20935 [Xanthobacteraceae bacterium]|nr:hypothetical protein [Xanthobacteraceae bacterium]